MDDERKMNRIEEERFRKLAQMNAALRAKLEFIQTKYDFTTNVNVLNSDDFKSLMTSNDMVRIQMQIMFILGESHNEGLHESCRDHQNRYSIIRGIEI